ncbi:hypothetical protein BKN38_03590 [Helicobacter sp. CLO-3]|uniref:DUF5644 domain-containing protein n=1 Tax=unclassified Helicobacter TaxID=2593540 RepID=UPI000804C388|nr:MULTISPECIES: DUF5644 domain-containing protein [unclassified Helicobacter]OBV28869.1 hypothetical protein BA723_07740 [Helicobacter sp. CLO-3]OHU84123.1 hypothetical protein BKN38_03590 [Helicobacter sp. CLO-3]
MRSVNLQIFRFCATKDYEYYFQRINLPYDERMMLFGALESISNASNTGDALGFDKSLGLRVNGLCVLEDVGVADLVRDFGEDLLLEPLSQKYATKDLILDKEAMFAQYDEFFAAHDFIKPSHRYDLHRFLYANTLSSQSNPSYLGDGFFLYIRWLLELYPTHFDALLESIAHPQNGVMSYAPLDRLIYAPSGKGAQITKEINELIRHVARFGRHEGQEGRAWLSAISKLYSKPKGLESSADLSGVVENAEAPKNSADSARKYMVFDAYEIKEAKSLVLSTKALLRALDLSLCEEGAAGANTESKKADSKKIDSGTLLPLLGYFGEILDDEACARVIAHNLSVALDCGAVLVFGDLDSFLRVESMLQNISQKRINACFQALLARHSLESIAKSFCYIGDIIYNNRERFASAPKAECLQSAHFVLYPSYTPNVATQAKASKNTDKSASKNKEVATYARALSQGFLAAITSAKWLNIAESRQDFSHLEPYNSEYYLKESARMRFCGIDVGASALVVASIALFRAFDTQAHKASKALGRDTDATPALFLPQVALLALGINDAKALGLQYHKLAFKVF